MFELDHGRYMFSSLSGTKCKCSAMQQQWPHINPAVLIYGLFSQRGPCPCQMLWQYYKCHAQYKSPAVTAHI